MVQASRNQTESAVDPSRSESAKQYHHVLDSMEMEELRVELLKKEEDLLLAARFGKKLLEENDLMKGEIQSLRDECRRYQEVSLRGQQLA